MSKQGKLKSFVKSIPEKFFGSPENAAWKEMAGEDYEKSRFVFSYVENGERKVVVAKMGNFRNRIFSNESTVALELNNGQSLMLKLKENAVKVLDAVHPVDPVMRYNGTFEEWEEIYPLGK